MPVPLPPDATPADLLAANLRRSLHRQAELLDLSIDPDDPKTNRLIADVANQTLNAALRAQENSLAPKRDGNRMASLRLMEAVRRAERLAEEDCAGDPAKSGGGGLNAL